ncbi:hypothetical protein [Desulfoferrobacter suflitae]|uniref:hypothetical protein n=1 Tax=Desulfoferrobacter suflitae TaxID=2865782 RepID=UPI002164DCFD|nr:hypothetical protein [Desulfoferrobacter suflitae]MCK8601329.1 hypothetical protein [Desulfoferrobacter suflitae]
MNQAEWLDRGSWSNADAAVKSVFCKCLKRITSLNPGAVHMPFQYVNRKGQTYYLHRGTTKTGKPKYYFSMKIKGDLVESLPDGYEIYEEPLRAQVFLQRCKPRSITDAEKTAVETAVKSIKRSRRYLVQARGKTITVHESDQDVDGLKASYADSFILISPSRLEESIIRSLSYTAVMRFRLVDEERRIFLPERYCFKGSIDDWIGIGAADRLNKLLGRFVKTLGTESFFELY